MDSVQPVGEVTESVKHGFKVLEFKKPVVEVVADPENEPTPVDLLNEVVQQDGETIKQLLIVYKCKDGGIHWVGNLGDDAGTVFFMEQAKTMIVEQSLCEDLDDDDDPSIS